MEAVSLRDQCNYLVKYEKINKIDVSLDPRFDDPRFRKSLLEWAQDRYYTKKINVLESLSKIGALKEKINLILGLNNTLVNTSDYSYQNILKKFEHSIDKGTTVTLPLMSDYYKQRKQLATMRPYVKEFL